MALAGWAPPALSQTLTAAPRWPTQLQQPRKRTVAQSAAVPCRWSGRRVGVVAGAGEVSIKQPGKVWHKVPACKNK
jgi:hypothetical protein